MLMASKSRKSSSAAIATLNKTDGVALSATSISRVLGRVIFIVMLSVIVLTAIPYGTVERWWVSLFEGVVFALTILWLIDGALSGRWLVRAHMLLMPLVALIAFCFAQTLPLTVSNVAGITVRQTISADAYQTKLVALEFLALALAAGMLLRYTSSVRRLHALIYTVIGVGLLSALFGLIRQTTQHTSSDFLLPYLRVDQGYGQFINKNHFAFLMEMVLGLALGIAAGGIQRSRIPVYFALALPVWTALILSNSRGGIFSMIAQVLFLGFLLICVQPTDEHQERRDNRIALVIKSFRRSMLFRIILLSCLAIAVFIGAIWIGGEPLVTRLETVPGEVSSENIEDINGAGRIAIWQATWQLIKDHPIAGIGFGGYRTAIPQYHRASGRLTPREAHNDYLELLASGGLIGVLLAGLFLSLFIKRVRERLRVANGFRRATIIGALVGLSGGVVHSFVDFGLHITINALVFVVLLVIASGEVGERSLNSSAQKARA